MKPKTDKSEQLYAMRHSMAHILATAIQRLWPSAKFGVGPVVENDFYYDIDLGRVTLQDEDLERIEAEMHKVIAENQIFEKFDKKIDEALNWAQKAKQPYKVELLNDLKRAGTTAASDIDATELGLPAGKKAKVSKVSFYRNGDFTDLCRGPHLKSTGAAGAFKLTRVSGAYWRGKETNPQLQRVYGVAFPTTEELQKHLDVLEEAKKRDHRVLGERLDLFTTSPEVGPGLILWLPKGAILKEEIEKLGKETEVTYGYQRVSTPHIAKQGLFYTSGHLPYFKSDMYPPMEMENDAYYLKPMNCPHMHMVYKARPHSYKELPIRFAEFGTVYRNEDSGTLMGLMRVRGLTQNDAHIYCTEDEAVNELVAVMNMHEYYYGLFGIADYYVELALPDLARKRDKYFDDPEGWEKAVSLLRKAAQKTGIKVVEKEGEAAFYGPKFDFNIKSVTGREFGASTNQLDFASGKRFDLKYADKDGKEKPVPFIIHRAPLGSEERFIGFLIEHYAGAFPVWLSPDQIRFVTVNNEIKTMKFIQRLEELCRSKGIRYSVDDSTESVSKKIRQSEIMKAPYTVVIGDKEIQSDKVTPRIRADLTVTNRTEPVKIETFISSVANEIKSRATKSSI